MQAIEGSRSRHWKDTSLFLEIRVAVLFLGIVCIGLDWSEF